MRLPSPAGRRLRTGNALLPFLPICVLSALGLAPVLPACTFAASPHLKQAPVAAAPTPVAPGSHAVVKATWDDSYLYFAFQVDDSNITGTNNRPMSHPEQDDGVGVYLQVGGGKPGAPDENTHAMLVSVAGGFTFLDGEPVAHAFVPKPTFSIKYGVTTEGTLNRSDDRDHSYTITMALPWSALGVDPKTLKPGTEIGFDAVARSRDPNKLTALAPGVITEADTVNPSKWVRLVLAAPDGSGAKPSEGFLIAPRVAVAGTPPLIDGAYRAADWPGTSRLSWTAPDKPQPMLVVAPSRPADFSSQDEVAPVLRFDQPFGPMQKLVMARYRIDYQADKRKLTVPQRGVFGPGDTLLLRDDPATGLGPWFSSDRTSWHRTELASMRHAGIDVALVQIGGPEGADALLDEKALMALVDGLREMVAAGTPAPLIAPLFDMSRLGGSSDVKLDLSQPKGRDQLYAAVRRWIRIVPPEFRERVTLPANASPSGALVSAYPVFLGDGALVIGTADPLWTDTIRDRFAKDYGILTGGTTLLFAGTGSGWDVAGAKLAAILPSSAGKGSGALSTFTVQPGCASEQGYVPREASAAYHRAWDAAIAAQPTWIVIDSWNDFTRGTEVTSSRQYGLQYADLTRIYTIQAAGLPERAVRWLAHDAPRRIRPGQVVATTVTVQNIGTIILRGDDGIALSYRWLQNGKVVAEGPLKLPLSGGLLPTQSAALPIGIAAASIDADGHATPLPAGDYVAEIDLTETKAVGDAAKTTWFGETGGGTPLRVSITVTPDISDYVQIDSTTTPTLMVGGGTYPTSVRVRWMGQNTLPSDGGALIYQILTEDGAATVRTGTAPLPDALTPGLWVTVPARVEASEAGVPIPPAYPEQRGQPSPGGSVGLGGYRVRWLLTRTQSVAPIPGEYDEEVAVYPPDDISVVAAPIPKIGDTMDTSALVPMSVTLRNDGANKWGKDAFSVGYHWYDADGVEAVWKPITETSLPADVPPGGTVHLDVNVRAPAREGTYILAFDVMRLPDIFLSTRPVTSSSDLGLMPVRVINGPLAFIDLTPLYNIDAISSEVHPKSGDFDGMGGAFPAESFPPDHFGIISYLAPDPDDKKQKFSDKVAYPSGFYSQGFSSARETAFKYGSDADGALNAVASVGEQINVLKGRYYGIHFAVTATGGAERPFAVTLNYKEGPPKIVIRTISDWNHMAGTNDAIAAATRFKRTPAGDISVPCSVWHLVMPVDLGRDLVSITLPDDKAIKVFAITLERDR